MQILTELTIEQLEAIVAKAVRIELQVLQISNECQIKVASLGNFKSTDTQPIYDDDIIDIGAASLIVGLSDTTLYSYCKKGRIPFIKNGRKTMFSKKAVLAWVDQNSESIELSKHIGIVLKSNYKIDVDYTSTAAPKHPITTPASEYIDSREGAIIFGCHQTSFNKLVRGLSLPFIKRGNLQFYSRHTILSLLDKMGNKKNRFGNKSKKNKHEIVRDMSYEEFTEIKKRQAVDNIKLYP